MFCLRNVEGTMARTQRPKRQIPEAFTLIELLVVISIISMIISITLPALSNAREAARATLCLSNMRQIGLMNEVYHTDSNGYLPVERNQSVGADDRLRYAPNDTGAWQIKLEYYMPYEREGSSELLISPAKQTVIHCPSFEPTGQMDYRVPFYSHSNYILLNEQLEPGDPEPRYVKGANVYIPSQKAFLIDVGPDASVPTTWFHLDNRFLNHTEDLFRYDHQGGASHLFFDGHAEVRGLQEIEDEGRWPWRTQFPHR